MSEVLPEVYGLEANLHYRKARALAATLPFLGGRSAKDWTPEEVALLAAIAGARPSAEGIDALERAAVACDKLHDLPGRAAGREDVVLLLEFLRARSPDRLPLTREPAPPPPPGGSR